LRIDVCQLVGIHCRKPSSGIAGPQAAAGRLDPHHVVEPIRQPRPAAGAHHAVEENIQRGVQSLRVKRAAGTEQHQADIAIQVEGRLASQQRFVWMTAATGPGIGFQVVQRHRVDTHVACRGAVNVAGPTRTRTLSIAQQTGSGSSQGMRTTAILRMSLRR
jgi:hypothetical protein